MSRPPTIGLPVRLRHSLLAMYKRASKRLLPILPPDLRARIPAASTAFRPSSLNLNFCIVVVSSYEPLDKPGVYSAPSLPLSAIFVPISRSQIVALVSIWSKPKTTLPVRDRRLQTTNRSLENVQSAIGLTNEELAKVDNKLENTKWRLEKVDSRPRRHQQENRPHQPDIRRIPGLKANKRRSCLPRSGTYGCFSRNCCKSASWSVLMRSTPAERRPFQISGRSGVAQKRTSRPCAWAL